MPAPSEAGLPIIEPFAQMRILTIDGARPFEHIILGVLEGPSESLRNTHLLLDFTQVAFLGSAELGALVDLHGRMKSLGGRLTLFNLSAGIYEVIRAGQLQRILSIVDNDPRPVVPLRTLGGHFLD